MWLMKTPEGFDEDGQIFGHQLVGGFVLVSKQYWWNFFKYRGFLDVTPAEWGGFYKKPKNISRVLHIHYGGIGDVMIISAVIKAYKKMYPASKHVVSTFKRSAELLKGNPDIESFIIDEQQQIAHYVEHFDDAITYDYSVSGNGEAGIRSVYDIYAEWAGVRLEARNKHPWIYLTLKEKEGLKTILKRNFGVSEDDKIITIQFESTSDVRNPEREKFITLAKMFRDEGYKVMLYGSTNISDYQVSVCECGHESVTVMPDGFVTLTRKCYGCGNDIEVVRDSSPKLENIHLVSGIGLRAIAYIISISKYFIGVDSSGLYIAAAFNIPSLGLFSSFESSLRIGYYEKAASMQLSYKCAPCFLHGSACHIMAQGNLRCAPCMSQFTPENIKQRFEETIAVGNYEKSPFPDMLKASYKCPVCGTESPKKFVNRKGSVIYVECDDCAAIFSDPLMDVSADLNLSERWFYERSSVYRKAQEDIAEHILEKIDGAKVNVLEIGCGNALMAKTLSSRQGLEYVGVDSSQMAVSIAKEHGISVICQDIFEHHASDYNLIILDKSLEVFHDPNSLFEKIDSMLANNGMIVIIMNNSDMWKKYNAADPIINTFVPGENAIIYNYESVEFLSRKNGFKINEIEEISETGLLMITISR